MTDYDDLARFRSKSGNAHFELRPVPSLAPAQTGNGECLPLSGAATAPRRQVAASKSLPEQPALHLEMATQERDMRARRAQLAGLFRRPEPLPAGRLASSGTLLKPLLRRIAEQARHA
ncbi:hypothetical protein A167_01401 [Alcanivorax sp. S71-1-4]|uniref:hypothetical protein n=1 Tax=Alcanivorax sp. S71-1-4 TaxID=1177159 RepID=UPI001359A7E0|nr:hypothetical protein [Alcanivorax sp. S71-1-4]KAF0809861.1 hypothetical protein A167_01401 [Alcanivorax sp. S71-1-4]